MNYLKYILFAALFIMIYLLFIRSPEGKMGKSAPDFTTTLITGEEFSLSHLKGQYVLLDFWGTWCAPCRKQNPYLVRLYEEFHNKEFNDADGFKVVTVALEKDNINWKKVSQKDGFKWPHQIVSVTPVVMLSSIAQKYNVKELPTKFFIGPNGEIISVNQSYETISAYLRKKST